MIRIFMTIAKEPLSFPELHKKLRMSKPTLRISKSTLFNHLEYLEKKAKAIYRDTIKADQTLKEEEVGKLVYKLKVDQIPNMLEEALSLLGMLSEPFEDKELDRKFSEYRRAIAELMNDYIIQLKLNRDQALRLEQENLKKGLTETKKEVSALAREAQRKATFGTGTRKGDP